MEHVTEQIRFLSRVRLCLTTYWQIWSACVLPYVTRRRMPRRRNARLQPLTVRAVRSHRGVVWASPGPNRGRNQCKSNVVLAWASFKVTEMIGTRVRERICLSLSLSLSLSRVLPYSFERIGRHRRLASYLARHTVRCHVVGIHECNLRQCGRCGLIMGLCGLSLV